MALDHLPPPVLDHLRRHAVILPVGGHCSGFAASEWPPAADAVEGRRWLVCRYEPMALGAVVEFMTIVAHEAAHAFLLPAAPKDPSPVAADEAIEAAADRRCYLALARAWDRMEFVLGPVELAERQAANLAAAWGFSGAGVDGERCALSMRRALLAEAAVATPPPDLGDE